VKKQYQMVFEKAEKKVIIKIEEIGYEMWKDEIYKTSILIKDQSEKIILSEEKKNDNLRYEMDDPEGDCEVELNLFFKGVGFFDGNEKKILLDNCNFRDNFHFDVDFVLDYNFDKKRGLNDSIQNFKKIKV
jgi:hypothetical protein